MVDTVIIGNPRHERLVNYVNEKGYASVEELASALDVSPQTIRRDIKRLAAQKLLLRHHGGAGRCSSVVNLDYEVRQVSETEEKEAIAEAIASSIFDNSTVFVSIGSTTEIIANHLLTRSGLRVITNSLRVANVLYSQPDFDVMVPGGKLRSNNSGIIGTTALEFVKKFRVDYLITSLGSIDTDGTMLDYDFNEVSIVQAVMSTARNTFIAADATKFSTSAAVELGNIKDVTALFTNKEPPADLVKILNNNNVQLNVVM